MFGYESRYARIGQKVASSSDLHAMVRLVSNNLEFHRFGELTLHENRRNFATIGLLLKDRGSRNKSRVVIYQVPEANGWYAIGTLEDITGSRTSDVDYTTLKRLERKHVEIPEWGGSSNLDLEVRIAFDKYRIEEFGRVVVYSNDIYQYDAHAIFLGPKEGNGEPIAAVSWEPRAAPWFRLHTMKEVPVEVVEINKRKRGH
ncbi:hypothetical protein HYX04_02805 [Candidatus Woesearchaeota archaeon]|nr:hypothetical protein [Candidatus Woesearchaeota archaeon]